MRRLENTSIDDEGNSVDAAAGRAREASHSWLHGATWVVGRGAGQRTPRVRPSRRVRYNDCISYCIYEYRIATVGYVCRRAP